MAENKVKLIFTLFDGSKKETEFILPDATVNVQADVYDRTPDVAAIPGMFGYGKVFSSGEKTTFKTDDEFLGWVKNAEPGRYAVYANTDVIIPGVLFSGIVEIIWPDPQSNPNPVYVPKVVIFYGINGHVYYTRYWTAGSGYLVGWQRWLFSVTDLAQILYGSDTSSWRAPLTGGLTLAAYLPENDGGSVSLLRGQGVQGSRLRPVIFEAEYRSSGFSATPRSFVYGNTLSGTYVALSGGPDVTFTKGIVSLFVRIA